MGKNNAKGVYLRFEEQRPLDVANQVIQGQISIEKAALLLKKSERQTRRIVKAVETKGVIGVKHGNTGRAPANKTDDAIKRLILDLHREKYFDFNLTHFIEILEKEHQLEGVHETLRIWAHNEGLVKRAKKSKRRSKARKRRNQANLFHLPKFAEWNLREPRAAEAPTRNQREPGLCPIDEST
jgi:hypothetical protein